MKKKSKTVDDSAARLKRRMSKLKYSPYMVDECLRLYLTSRRKQFKGSDKSFDRKVKPELKELLMDITQNLRVVLAKGVIRDIQHVQRYHKKISMKIARIHKGSIQLLDFLIQLNASIARDCYLHYHKKFKGIGDQLKLDALIELHSRACQVAAEINLLVKNGFADGAQARWRSLHELCVTFLFLYDNDSITTTMYLDYADIEGHKKLIRYVEAHPKLKWRPIPQNEIDVSLSRREALIKKYGSEFGKDYGWTMNVLPKGQRHFKGIEQAVWKDDLRGIYSWSSENVHAGVLGNQNRLGLPSGKQCHLLTGASEFGVFDPIQFTSFSLIEMTVVLLSVEATTLNQIKDDLLWGFHDGLIQVLKKEDKKLKAEPPLSTQRAVKSRKFVI